MHCTQWAVALCAHASSIAAQCIRALCRPHTAYDHSAAVMRVTSRDKYDAQQQEHCRLLVACRLCVYTHRLRTNERMR
jgi:hypothetical protein